MNLSGLLSWIRDLPTYQSLLRELVHEGEVSPLGLARAARPAVLAALTGDLGRPVLVAVGSAERARMLHESLRRWHPQPEQVVRLPEPPILFYERAPWPREVPSARVAAVVRLAAGEPGMILVASARALMQPTISPRALRVASRTIRLGQSLDIDRTLRWWLGIGYEPVSVVEAPGQFSRRGGILDIYPPTVPLPVRIELFGQEVESIRQFDPATQRSRGRLESVTIPPAREALPRYGPELAAELSSWFEEERPPDTAEELSRHREALASAAPFPGLEFYLPFLYQPLPAVIDHLPAHGMLVVDDWEELSDTWAELEEQAVDLRETAHHRGEIPPNYPVPYLTWDEWRERLLDRPILHLGHAEGETVAAISEAFIPGRRYGGRVYELVDEIERALLRGEQVVVVSRQARRLAQVWAEAHEPRAVEEALWDPPSSDLVFVQGALDEGWVLEGIERPARVARLLTDSEIFGWRMPEPRRPVRRRRPAPESLYADLSPGDYVVHVDYGVGVFRGLVSYTLEGEEREYLLVEYAGQDRLYVPVHQADRISRYVGADDRPPALNRLGTAEWSRIKARARHAVEEIARDLLELYAMREVTPGHAFSPDTPWQAELEASFPYLETPDQAQAIAEVKADMERPRPMDRLICGDAGYGKTEVALRAAFKAVMDGKQVAILVPTTVLAQQHYTTFRTRLAPFPVTVEMLSRFRSPAEQARILEGLRTGTVDIVIGTHRLLQRDVEFKDLGLVIIDEEQRFGVTHKEQLKKMRTEVDVLTMTATPIPRTLYLSLAGVRDISIIETPPEERLPVTTYVGRYDPQIVRRAILRELERSGQVFYVHNRVQTIDTVRRRLEQLVPEARIVVAHGQMRERDLERAMIRFVEGAADVLLCTTIIESGLDIPNANTLIVEQAERFGLAQLYQLRGRVGRGTRRAFAYFFTTPGRLTEEARQRLETIREVGGLGAGYAIAMRDLELRGAGEILGTRQSGHIAAVGFDLYTRLLARAIEELRAKREGRPPPPEPLSEIRLDLPLPMALPPDYVPDTALRLRLYRRLANLGSLEQIDEVEAELVDRFGPLPPRASNLIWALRVKVLAQAAGVRSILTENDHLVLYADWLGRTDRLRVQRRLGGLAHVGRRDVRLPLTDDWQKRLWAVLERLRPATK